MLASGEGCELNRPLGAYWLAIAASRHDENEFVTTAADSERELKQFLKEMNPDQIRSENSNGWLMPTPNSSVWAA